MRQASVHYGSTIRSVGPYDRGARETLAAELIARDLGQEPLGTLARGHRILKILELTYPSPALSAAYFENLDRMLAARKKLPSPGRLLLGLGAGRCGSTSLTALAATIEGSCTTHENPPLIFWDAEDQQVAFHLRRFELLTRYFPLVFDAAHWWLNVVDRVFANFPDARAVGLRRNLQPCVRSFMSQKGSGRDSVNHWVAPGNGIWSSTVWDAAYPTYPRPDDSQAEPDRAKADLIGRYVMDYNRGMEALAKHFPGRVMLIQTEKLERISVQQRFFEFVGLPGRPIKAHLNEGTTSDGQSLEYRF